MAQKVCTKQAQDEGTEVKGTEKGYFSKAEKGSSDCLRWQPNSRAQNKPVSQYIKNYQGN